MKKTNIISILIILLVVLTACSKKDIENNIILDDNYRTFYQIFPYSFADSNGDGIGDLNGIIENLDYLNDGNYKSNSDLEVTGLWLTPIMPSDSYHKYDVNDYYSIDSSFGTIEDFKRLVDESHKRDIKVIIDLVFNHTGSNHPWFLEAKSYLQGLGDGIPNSKDCKYFDYYHFKQDKGSDDSYHKIEKTKWYYEGVFWGGMPDLNLASEDVRREIEDIAKFWIDLGVDGFRLDAAKEFYSGEKDRNIEVLKWFSEYVKQIKEDAYIVAEVWESESSIAAYYESEILSLFNFPLSQHDGLIIKAARNMNNINAKTFFKNIIKLDEMYKSSNEKYIDSPFISNHDTSRISAQCLNNENEMKMATGLLLTMKGSPFIYYGEEIGMNSYSSKDENKRLPMSWSSKNSKYMTKGPKDADEVLQEFEALDKQQKDSNSLLSYYKKGIRIRNKYPSLARGDMELIEDLSQDSIAVIKRVYKDEEIILIYNISKEETDLEIKDEAYKGLKVADYLTITNKKKVKYKNGKAKLPAYSITILK